MNIYKIPHWQNQIAFFLLAQSVSLLGSALVQYAIIWHITLTTSSGKMLALSTICGFAPQIMISLFAGLWADRFNRKKMIMLSDGLIALSTLGAAAAFALGFRNPAVLFIVLAVRSAGTGLQTPAVNAVIPQMVPKKYLIKVNGIFSTISSFTLFAAPALSGAVLSLASLEAVLIIDVATAILGIGITAFIPILHHRVEAKKSSSVQDLKEGFHYLRANGFLAWLLRYQLVTFFLISPSAFLTPLMVSRSFGPEIWRLTVGEMCYGAGSLLGGLIITAWGGLRSRMAMALGAAGFYGLLIIGLGLSPWFFLYLILTVLIGLAGPCYHTPLTTLIQEKVNPAFHGRVFSFMQISTGAAMPLGMLVFGPMADFIPIQFLMISNGFLIFCLACGGLRKAFPKR